MKKFVQALKSAEVPTVPQPRNPNSNWYTVRIPQSMVPFIHERAQELGVSQARYVQNLIQTDRINLKKPTILYPLGYDGPALSLAEKPDPYGKKKHRDA